MRRIPLAAPLVTMALASTAGWAQAPPSVVPARAEILSAAKVIIDKARFATLVSVDDTGHPQARIVDPFVPEADLTIWVATNALSRKVGEIAADPRVTLTYFDAAGGSYVTLRGTAISVRDAAEKAKRWKEEWSAFYKDRNRGDDYLLLRITPTRLEVVSPSLGMLNDATTWRPVTLDLATAPAP